MPYTVIMRTIRYATPAIAVALISVAALATPRLAAKYSQDCHLCHVNPTGGGLRNAFATALVVPQELALQPLSAHEKSRWPAPHIAENITIGTDLRMLYLAHDNVSTGSGNVDNTFFQMQGDIYLAFEPDPDFVIYLDKGLYSGFEAFVLARILPAHGYLKAGQFVPDIGWRWDDHNRYTREKLDLDFPGATDAGIEVGIRPGRLVVSAGVFNGAGGNALDNNTQKAYVGRILYRHGIGPVQLALGGTARLNRNTELRERLWGVLTQASWGPFEYLADFYGRRSEPIGGTRTWAWLFSQELDWQPRRGLDVFVAYDFLDPDADRRSGTQTQISIGSRIYVRHFLKLEPVFRIEEGETPPGRSTNNRWEIVLHAFY